MAIPPKPTITPLPTAPDVADQGTFNDRANLFVPALPTFGGELDDVAVWTGDRATDSETAQTAAETAQGLAETAQAGAETAQTAAEGARDTALTHRDAAEGFKDQAETASAAAGAAAGLPTLVGNAGNVLKVAAGESGVEWGPGLIFEEFTTSGTWTKAAGVTQVMVEMVSGGDGGDARVGSQTSLQADGGIAIERLFDASDLPASVTVEVGAGGAGAVANTSAIVLGSPGGQSRFYDGATTYLETPTARPFNWQEFVYGRGSNQPTLKGGGGTSGSLSGGISYAHGNGGDGFGGVGSGSGGNGEFPGGAGGCSGAGAAPATGGDGADGVVRILQW